MPLPDTKTYQYPVDNYNQDAPFVLFMQIVPSYESNLGNTEAFDEVENAALTNNSNVDYRLRRAANLRDHKQAQSAAQSIWKPKRSIEVPTNESVGIYVPTGFNITDTANWEQAATGAFGRLVQSIERGTGWQDVTGFASDIADSGKGSLANPDVSSLLTSNLGTLGAGAATGGAAKVVGKIPGLKKVGGGLSSLVSGVIGFGAAELASREISKRSQTVLNPRQFLLFSGPSMRSFSLSFNFVPSSAQESDMTHNIIKWFRTGMYPELSELSLGYIFPSAFLISFENVGEEAIPKIPELALQSLSVTYNPNTMSYFESDGRPVEINLELQFAELEPIHKKMVIDGY